MAVPVSNVVALLAVVIRPTFVAGVFRGVEFAVLVAVLADITVHIKAIGRDVAIDYALDGIVGIHVVRSREVDRDEQVAVGIGGIGSAKRPEPQHKIQDPQHQLPHHPHAYDLSQADAEPSSAAKRRRGRAGPFIARRI
jgi:hypothetical protein